MTRSELIQYCLDHYECFEDYPFDDVSAVMKHTTNKKMFALIAIRNDALFINLKCDPDEAITLRDMFEGIAEGYHMNKRHWNTVIIESDVPMAILMKMIHDSYELIVPRKRRKK